jgi:Protein of unknown function (DUF533)
MDAIEILGGILRKSGGSGGLGGKILKDIVFGGGQKKPQQQQPAPAQPSPRETSHSSREVGHTEFSREAQALEDLLNVAAGNKPSQQRHPQQTQSPPSRSNPSQQFPSGNQSSRNSNDSYRGQDSYREVPYAEAPDPRNPQTPSSPSRSAPSHSAPSGSSGRPTGADQEEQAVLLIRAMINAAKCDGNISREEQDKVLSQLENPTEQDIQFLRKEFAAPLDVREFAWSVPLGLEQQVYAMTLFALSTYSRSESQYVADLAHGLRLNAEIRNQIHQHYGFPTVQR